jgi:hypothetical protein
MGNEFVGIPLRGSNPSADLLLYMGKEAEELE